MNNTLLLAAGAGILGTGLGGVLGIFFAGGSGRVLSKMLAFAAGIMVSIVSLELMPEAMMISGIFTVAMGMIAGIYIMVALNFVVERLSGMGRATLQKGGNRQLSMRRMGMMMFLAIMLHNLPEGIAIGSGSSHSSELGVGLALVIALHDIPEGMTISAPLVTAGINKVAAAALAALSGSSTLLGAAMGFALGSISRQLAAISIASAGGAMLYVVFAEIFPESLELTGDRSPAIFAAIGFIVGMVATLC